MLIYLKKKILDFSDKLFSFLPIKKTFVFESNPDYSCNTYPVFNYLYNAQWTQKWKFVWICKKECSQSSLPRVKNLVIGDASNKRSILNILISRYYLCTSKCLISCNQIMPKKRKGQLALFLSHGSKTKKTRGICEIGNAVDYVLVQSHFFDDIICYEYNLKQEQLVYLGYPRNDSLFRAEKDIGKLFNLPEGSKYAIWLPTFRKAVSANRTDAVSRYDNLGMPLIYNEEILKRLNNYLVANNFFIIYKPHPAQDISALKASSMSNLIIIDDNFLTEKKLQLSDVLAKSQALLTDYSSVFFDYILIDRPIGTTTDDIEEWKNGRGFAFDLESMYDKATVRIPDINKLIEFLDGVLAGDDKKKEERREICTITNMYIDGHSTERVANFIAEKLKKI